jgi:hypothetical protein
MEHNQKQYQGTQYQGPERRKSELEYTGPRRRRLDWPFRPLTPAERHEGLPDKATPGRADEAP